MAYGVLWNLENGNPFVTPNSVPFCLYGKYTYQSSGTSAYHTVAQNIPIPSSYPAIVFIKSTHTTQPTPLMAYRIGNNIHISGGNPYGESFTVTVYIFARFPQTLPNYGFAIWDENGTLVVTNESKVLTDLVTVGGFGNSGGVNIDQTFSGSYAISPTRLGAVVGTGASDIYASCRFTGSTTRINAGRTTPGTGNTINNGNVVIAINTASYD